VAQQEAMNLMEFMERYDIEEKCREYLYGLRWPEGFVYRRLTKEGFLHEAEVFDHKENPEHLQWLHTLISNAKACISETYHGLDDIHLQAFLDEFCFRFNRRRRVDRLFARTLIACSVAKPFPRYALV
jgi:hypothetical protein